MPAIDRPRVAILGFSLESNGFSPIATKAAFVESYYLTGEALAADIARAAPRVMATVSGFVAEMERTGGLELVPIAVARTSPSGPADQAFFDEFMGEVKTRLEAAGPVDAVYISEHGAASATGDHDPDGTLFRLVRGIVGANVPVVATLDLHANVSEEMVAATDLLVAYVTNPHVDQFERGVETARALREILGGVRTARSFVRVPLLPPSVTLLTAAGPYADLISYGQSRIDARIINVSICAGFFLTDSPKAGMAIVVTARGDQSAADALAHDLAMRAWADRHRYVPRLTGIDEATRRMVSVAADPSLPALAFADVADNPGGGGRSNTTWLLEAFHAAGVTGVALGVFNDPALAREAHEKGVGARFLVRFNRDETHEMSRPFAAEGEVIALSDGKCVGRRGSAVGRALDMGAAARIRVGGIDVVVCSIRIQCTDPILFESLGIDIAGLRGLIVKSRGHFRAGFDEFFKGEQIVEVDAPGLTTPILSRLPYRNVSRPIYPLDPDMTWSPSGQV